MRSAHASHKTDFSRSFTVERASCRFVSSFACGLSVSSSQYVSNAFAHTYNRTQCLIFERCSSRCPLETPSREPDRQSEGARCGSKGVILDSLQKCCSNARCIFTLRRAVRILYLHSLREIAGHTHATLPHTISFTSVSLQTRTDWCATILWPGVPRPRRALNAHYSTLTANVVCNCRRLLSHQPPFTLKHACGLPTRCLWHKRSPRLTRRIFPSRLRGPPSSTAGHTSPSPRSRCLVPDPRCLGAHCRTTS